MNILVAPNSFKECASSVSVASLIQKTLSRKFSAETLNKINFRIMPLSDGGDGFVEVAEKIFSLKILSFEISTPWLEGKIKTTVGYSENEKKVFIESAKVLGLNIIPEFKRKPLKLSSIGLGEILLFLSEKKKKGELQIDEVLIGIGGTGTNDLALGALEILGLKLLDAQKQKVKALPENFGVFESISELPMRLPFNIKLVTDVTNPFLGKNGATRIYGKQKGIVEEEFEFFEKGFEKIISLAGIDEKKKNKLSGAGGGLAAGFQIFYDAEIIPALQFIREVLGINSKRLKPDLIITGEGKLDSQTLMGKGIGVILNEFPETEKIIICGTSELDAEIPNTEIIELLNYFQTQKESIERFEEGIEKAAEVIAKRFFN